MNNEFCLRVIRFDGNLDGVVTISDITGLIKTLFFYPGDMFIAAMHGTTLGNFFEISWLSCGGFFSVLTSVLAWLIVWIGLFFAKHVN